MIAISPQTEENSRKIIEQQHLTFDVLSDKENRVAEIYGLRFKLPDDLREIYSKFGIDLPKFNGDDSWTLPMPARFVIDQDFTARKVDADPDYTIRPEPSETIEFLREMLAGK